MSAEPVSVEPVSVEPMDGVPVGGVPGSGIPVSGVPNSGGPNSGGPNSGGPNSGGPVNGVPNSGGPNSVGASELPDFWTDLRRSTQSRIGLGRVGDAMPTGRVLEFRRAHAIARDAVHDPLDVEALVAQVTEVGLGVPTVVRSRASGRAEYLRRPDLGRLPDDLSPVPPGDADLGFVLCDGLSALALQAHGAAMLAALVRALPSELSLAAPVIATQARVALGDHLGARMGVRTLIVLIGERPGLSVADSLGVYLTHRPAPGRTDADRNCVSNIHPPEGLGYTAAAGVVRSLVLGARALGRSGVDLKDSSREAALAPGSPAPEVAG